MALKAVLFVVCYIIPSVFSKIGVQFYPGSTPKDKLDARTPKDKLNGVIQVSGVQTSGYYEETYFDAQSHFRSGGKYAGPNMEVDTLGMTDTINFKVGQIFEVDGLTHLNGGDVAVDGRVHCAEDVVRLKAVYTIKHSKKNGLLKPPTTTISTVALFVPTYYDDPGPYAVKGQEIELSSFLKLVVDGKVKIKRTKEGFFGHDGWSTLKSPPALKKPSRPYKLKYLNHPWLIDDNPKLTKSIMRIDDDFKKKMEDYWKDHDAQKAKGLENFNKNAKEVLSQFKLSEKDHKWMQRALKKQNEEKAHSEYEEMMADFYYDEEVAVARENKAERILSAHLASGQKAMQMRGGRQVRQKKRSNWEF